MSTKLMVKETIDSILHKNIKSIHILVSGRQQFNYIRPGPSIKHSEFAMPLPAEVSERS